MEDALTADPRTGSGSTTDEVAWKSKSLCVQFPNVYYSKDGLVLPFSGVESGVSNFFPAVEFGSMTNAHSAQS